jgi:hypothetical protein
MAMYQTMVKTVPDAGFKWFFRGFNNAGLMDITKTAVWQRYLPIEEAQYETLQS